MFNTTHRIRHLSFGSKITQTDGTVRVTPLDGHVGHANEGMVVTEQVETYYG